MQAHKKVLDELDEVNARRVQLENGEFVNFMGFEEAFLHHVHYVYCRAKGHFGAKLGRRPEFCDYVRGVPPPIPPSSVYVLQP